MKLPIVKKFDVVAIRAVPAALLTTIEFGEKEPPRFYVEIHTPPIAKHPDEMV